MTRRRGLLRTRLLANGWRALAVVTAIAACAVARHFGGGAEASAPPRGSMATITAADGGERGAGKTSPGAPPAARALAGDGYEVAVRLVELASHARFEMPRADAAHAMTKARWRPPPFIPVSGDAERFVATIALATNASEAASAMRVGKVGKAWAATEPIPDLNEGSVEQREALVSPAPGTISFRVNVPHGAKLTFAEATANAREDATEFLVSLLDGKGAMHEVHRHVVEPSASRRWTEMSCDLSAFAGQEVELRLSTAIAKATAVERSGHHRRSSLDGGTFRSSPRSRDPRAPVDASAGVRSRRTNVDDAGVRADGGPNIPVAFWGNPTIFAKAKPRVPYNVLWIVVDALRPDVIGSFHDDVADAAKHAASLPPLEALLPKVPGLTPEIDALTKRGVRFTSAYSAGSWTRPGTLAMLAGARSSELGIDTTEWIVTPAQAAAFYRSDPPLLSVALRRQNVTTCAFVNNDFMVGYTPFGIEMGFERVQHHRYRTRDTVEIAHDARRWLEDNKNSRFFAFVNFNSPHEPHEPPSKYLEKVPPPPVGPKDEKARRYMGEGAKDDEAIGVLMRTLEETGLRDHTIVVVTSGHGETLSSAHVRTTGSDLAPVRYHHSAGHFEETTKVPIVIVAPGLLPAGVEVKARVRSIDIAPTVLELLGLEPHARTSGASLVPLARGQQETEERVVVSEGRGTRSIMHGRWRLLLREGAAQVVGQGEGRRAPEVELYDLVDDPGERRDLASTMPEMVAEMRARLDAALKNVAVAGGARPSGAAASQTQTPGSTAGPGDSAAAAAASASPAAPAASASPAKSAPDADVPLPPRLHLRFVGGAASRRVSGSIMIGDKTTKPRSFDVHPVEVGRDAFHLEGDKVDIALRTNPSIPVGFDIVVDPPGTPVTWTLWLDDKPWPDDAVFGGRFGLLSSELRRGVATDQARFVAQSSMLPMIDPRREVGLFVIRDRRRGATTSATSATSASDRGPANESTVDLASLLREWGYTDDASTQE